MFHAKHSPSTIMKHTHYFTGLSTAYLCFSCWAINSIPPSTSPTRVTSTVQAGQHRSACVWPNDWVVLWMWMLKMLLPLKCFWQNPSTTHTTASFCTTQFGKCYVKLRTTFQTGFFFVLLEAFREHCYISNSKAFWIFSNLIIKACK